MNLRGFLRNMSDYLKLTKENLKLVCKFFEDREILDKCNFWFLLDIFGPEFWAWRDVFAPIRTRRGQEIAVNPNGEYDLEKNMNYAEKELLLKALAASSWCQRDAAKLCNTTEATFSRHLKKHGIELHKRYS